MFFEFALDASQHPIETFARPPGGNQTRDRREKPPQCIDTRAIQVSDVAVVAPGTGMKSAMPSDDSK